MLDKFATMNAWYEHSQEYVVEWGEENCAENLA